MRDPRVDLSCDNRTSSVPTNRRDMAEVPFPGPSASSGGSSSAGVNAGAAAKKKQTTICAVCGVESDNHHVHYGALACFSCRAFFRR